MAGKETVAKLVQERGGARGLFTVLFGLWGGIGLLLIFIEVMATNSMTTVGVGQSAYVTMHILLYLAGTVFFGLCALLSAANFEFRRSEPIAATATEAKAAATAAATTSRSGWESQSAWKK